MGDPGRQEKRWPRREQEEGKVAMQEALAKLEGDKDRELQEKQLALDQIEARSSAP